MPSPSVVGGGTGAPGDSQRVKGVYTRGGPETPVTRSAASVRAPPGEYRKAGNNRVGGAGHHPRCPAPAPPRKVGDAASLTRRTARVGGPEGAPAGKPRAMRRPPAFATHPPVRSTNVQVGAAASWSVIARRRVNALRASDREGPLRAAGRAPITMAPGGASGGTFAHDATSVSRRLPVGADDESGSCLLWARFPAA